MKNKLPRNTPVKETVYVNIQEEIDVVLEDLLTRIILEYNQSYDSKLNDKHVELALSGTTQQILGEEE
tara:strand:+ start:199 stop:402 length:204 start_codon:yes stop_codon:yes gene_type:complete